MGTNAQQADAGGEGSPEIDDLKRIPGIGPVIERQLREAGVRTFAQLAALSPDQIAALVAHLPLLSAERIVRQDWAGRARALAREAARPGPGDHGARGLRAAGFTVELLLDHQGQVVRTRAVDRRDGAEQTWEGWDASRLIGFFGACVPGLDTAAMGGQGAMEQGTPATEAELELGEFRVETEPQDEPGAGPARADLWARLSFALTGPGAARAAAERAHYSVAILAVDQAGGAPALIGAHHGRLHPEQQHYTPLVALAPPSEGRFQLLGTVLIAPAGLVKSALGPVLHVVV